MAPATSPLARASSLPAGKTTKAAPAKVQRSVSSTATLHAPRPRRSVAPLDAPTVPPLSRLAQRPRLDRDTLARKPTPPPAELSAAAEKSLSAFAGPTPPKAAPVSAPLLSEAEMKPRVARCEDYLGIEPADTATLEQRIGKLEHSLGLASSASDGTLEERFVAIERVGLPLSRIVNSAAFSPSEGSEIKKQLVAFEAMLHDGALRLRPGPEAEPRGVLRLLTAASKATAKAAKAKPPHDSKPAQDDAALGQARRMNDANARHAAGLLLARKMGRGHLSELGALSKGVGEAAIASHYEDLPFRAMELLFEQAVCLRWLPEDVLRLCEPHVERVGGLSHSDALIGLGVCVRCVGPASRYQGHPPRSPPRLPVIAHRAGRVDLLNALLAMPLTAGSHQARSVPLPRPSRATPQTHTPPWPGGAPPHTHIHTQPLARTPAAAKSRLTLASAGAGPAMRTRPRCRGRGDPHRRRQRRFPPDLHWYDRAAQDGRRAARDLRERECASAVRGGGGEAPHDDDVVEQGGGHRLPPEEGQGRGADGEAEGDAGNESGAREDGG